MKRSMRDWILEVVSAVALAGLFAVVLFYWGDLPDRVPRHFGPSGVPDAWGARGELWILPFTGLGLYALLTAASRYQGLINMPVNVDRDSPEVRQVLSEFCITLKAVLSVKLLYMVWMHVHTALGRANGLGSRFLPISLTVIAVPMVWYYLRLRRYAKQ